MKSILHLKEDTEYQIPLREKGKDDRAKVGTTTANPVVDAKKEDQQNSEASKEKVIATQSQDGPTAKKETDEITPEEVNNENDSALDNLEDETQTQEQSNTEESNSDTTTESVPQVDTAKAALDEMKKLASQEGVIHPSLFISNFSKILGLMERAMQLQVKESGSVAKEEAPEATEKTEVPAEGKQGELNGNNRS